MTLRQLAQYRIVDLCRTRRDPLYVVHTSLPCGARVASSNSQTPTIIALNGAPSGAKLSSRARNRIRHSYRSCHSRDLEHVHDVRMATINCQGWNWSASDSGNRDKAVQLVEFAREHRLDVIALSDVHTIDGQTLLEVLAGAQKQYRDARDAIVALEEFVVIFATRCALLLSPAAVKAWRDGGAEVNRCAGGRLLAVQMKIKNLKIDLVAGYCPTGDPHGRRFFFDEAEQLR